jgi:hypothetical protein
MSATGPDWTPPAFVAITAPTLKAADFSSVKLLGEEKTNAGSSSNSSSEKITVVQVNITNTSDIDSVVESSQDNTAVSVVSQMGGTSCYAHTHLHFAGFESCTYHLFTGCD